MPHVPLLVESSLQAKTAGLGSKGVLVEQDGKVRVASLRNELVGDVSNAVTSFLIDDCAKSSAGGGYDLCGIPARWAWIPLQNGETKLMMHKVTVRIVNVDESSRFGLSKTDHGQVYRPRLRGRATSSTWVCTNGRVGSRKGLLWACEERAECVPTWEVLTCGCKNGVAVV